MFLTYDMYLKKMQDFYSMYSSLFCGRVIFKDLRTYSSTANIRLHMRDPGGHCQSKVTKFHPPVSTIKSPAWWQNPTQGKTRSVLHCNRFQMVLETEADSEHQKKSVNLGLRTKGLSCQNITVDWWFHTE